MYQQIKIKLTVARLRLLRDCNAQCIVCRCWRVKHIVKNIPELQEFYLSREKISQLYPEFKALGVKEIILTGGEPTLREDIFSIIREGKEKFGFNFELYTNGLKLTKDYIDTLIDAGLGKIAVSVDSANPVVHDKLRGVKGSFDKSYSALKYLDGKMPTTVRSVVSKFNYRDLDKMVIFAKNLNVKRLSFQQVIGGSRKYMGLNKDEFVYFYNKVVPKIIRLSLKYSIQAGVSPFFVQLIKKPARIQILELIRNISKFDEELENYSKGYFGLSYFSQKGCVECVYKTQVKEDGAVNPCCFLTSNEPDVVMSNVYKNTFLKIWNFLTSNEPDVVMGNVYKNTFLEIWNSKEYKDFRAKKGLKHKACATCHRMRLF